MNTWVIVNPHSRLGETGKRRGELAGLLRSYVGTHRWVETEAPRHAQELAAQALDAGAERLIVAGGDGTMSEIVNTLVTHPKGSSALLVPLPLGTGRDFARLLGLGADLETAVSRIQHGAKRRVDAALVTCRGSDGNELQRAFLNITSLGLTGEAALWLEEQAKLGRRNKLSYTTSGVVGLTRYKAPSVHIRVDGQLAYEGPISLAAVANGQYFAGGMRIAPSAAIDDGELDFVIIPKFPFLKSLLKFPSIVRGTHVRDPGVVVKRGKAAELHSEGEVWLEADGEPIGMLPARVDVCPAAVQLGGLPPLGADGSVP